MHLSHLIENAWLKLWFGVRLRLGGDYRSSPTQPLLLTFRGNCVADYCQLPTPRFIRTRVCTGESRGTATFGFHGLTPPSFIVCFPATTNVLFSPPFFKDRSSGAGGGQDFTVPRLLAPMAGLLGFRVTEGREPKEHWQPWCPAKNLGTPRDPPEDRLFVYIARGLVATCK